MNSELLILSAAVWCVASKDESVRVNILSEALFVTDLICHYRSVPVVVHVSSTWSPEHAVTSPDGAIVTIPACVNYKHFVEIAS